MTMPNEIAPITDQEISLVLDDMERSATVRLAYGAFVARVQGDSVLIDQLLAALETGIGLYESYGLVAGHVPGDPLSPYRWANSARDAISRAKRVGRKS